MKKGAGVARSSLLVALFSSLAAGCAMSWESFDRLASEVAARNEARRQVALEELRARGYELTDDSEYHVSLSEEAKERCLALAYGLTDEGTSNPVEIIVSTRTPPHPTPPPARRLYAPEDEACAFFGRTSRALVVTDPDGGVHEVVRLDEGSALATGPGATLVYVDVDTRVVSERVVRVDTTCNEMPRPAMHPLEESAGLRVLFGPEPAERVTLTIEREELHHECTDVVE